MIEVKRRRNTVLLLTAATSALSLGALASDQDSSTPSLEETRLKMAKWIETQQIISKERNEWQQGKEILQGRLQLVKDEIAGLEKKIGETQTTIAESAKKRDELQKELDQLETVGTQLRDSVTGLEGELRPLFKMLPESLQKKLEPLYGRIPADPATAKSTVPERFQNVLGILSEVNKANTEINVNYEVRELSPGKPAEVKAIYIGLAQAYYVSSGGEAGIGRPAADGWTWEPSKGSASDIERVLEILQGKQTPAFVPLPVKIQ